MKPLLSRTKAGLLMPAHGNHTCAPQTIGQHMQAAGLTIANINVGSCSHRSGLVLQMISSMRARRGLAATDASFKCSSTFIATSPKPKSTVRHAMMHISV